MQTHPAVKQARKLMPPSLGMEAYRNRGMGATLVRSYSEGGLPEEKVLLSVGPWAEKRGVRSEPGYRNPLSYSTSLFTTLVAGGAFSFLFWKAKDEVMERDWTGTIMPVIGAGLITLALSPSEYTV